MLLFFAEALSVLNANRTRSFLTLLGLIIGVMAVIAIQVLGAGLSGAVGGVLGGISDRSFFVFPNVRQSDFAKARIKPSDIEKLKVAVPSIADAIPGGNIERVIAVGHAHSRFSIVGETDDRYFTTPRAYGRAFSENDIANAAHVVMISDRAYTTLFPDGGDVTGQSLRIGDRRYAIVGILEKPKTGFISFNISGDVYMPYTTYVSEFVHDAPVFAMKVYVLPDASVTATEHATTDFLKAQKRVKVEYQTFDRKTFTTLIDNIFNGVTLVVALIGAVSLLVAGIGILNIMLVSVAERTREIGLRKAIGATRNQILAQFFIEALVLSGIGCAIGLVLGVGIGWAVNTFLLVRLSGIVAPIPWIRSIAIATGFATIVTLAFGTYPAYRAASLDPIEALRYE